MIYINIILLWFVCPVVTEHLCSFYSERRGDFLIDRHPPRGRLILMSYYSLATVAMRGLFATYS